MTRRDGAYILTTRAEKYSAWLAGPVERPRLIDPYCDNCGCTRSDVILRAEDLRITDPICCEVTEADLTVTPLTTEP